MVGKGNNREAEKGTGLMMGDRSVWTMVAIGLILSVIYAAVQFLTRF